MQVGAGERVECTKAAFGIALESALQELSREFVKHAVTLLNSTEKSSRVSRSVQYENIVVSRDQFVSLIRMKAHRELQIALSKELGAALHALDNRDAKALAERAIQNSELAIPVDSSSAEANVAEQSMEVFVLKSHLDAMKQAVQREHSLVMQEQALYESVSAKLLETRTKLENQAELARANALSLENMITPARAT